MFREEASKEKLGPEGRPQDGGCDGQALVKIGVRGGDRQTAWDQGKSCGERKSGARGTRDGDRVGS